MKYFLILISVLIFLNGCSEDSEQKKESTAKNGPIKIGVIGPFSGPDIKWGENGLAGIRIATQQHHMIATKSSIKIVKEDDQNDPEITKKVFIKLAEQEEIQAIIMLSQSSAVSNILASAEKYKIPTFALMSTHPDITKDNNYVSQLLFNNILQARVAALYARDELLIDRAAVVINEENPSSNYLAEKFTEIFRSVGGYCQEITMRIGDETYNNQLTQLKEMAIDFVYLPIDAKYVVPTVEIMHKADYHPTLMSSDGMQPSLLLNHPESLAMLDGMLATEPYSSDAPLTDYGEMMVKLYKKNITAQATSFAAQGIEGIAILLDAIERCTWSINRECINTRLRSTTGFMGIQGIISIHEDGKAERAVFLNKIDNKKLRTVIKIH